MVWAGCWETPNNRAITSANKTSRLPPVDPEGQGEEVVTGTWKNHVERTTFGGWRDPTEKELEE